MTNLISDLITNNLNITKDTSTSSQYMAQESDNSFDLILNNLNQSTLALEKDNANSYFSKKTSNDSFFTKNTHENSHEKSDVVNSKHTEAEKTKTDDVYDSKEPEEVKERKEVEDAKTHCEDKSTVEKPDIKEKEEVENNDKKDVDREDSSNEDSQERASKENSSENSSESMNQEDTSNMSSGEPSGENENTLSSEVVINTVEIEDLPAEEEKTDVSNLSDVNLVAQSQTMQGIISNTSSVASTEALTAPVDEAKVQINVASDSQSKNIESAASNMQLENAVEKAVEKAVESASPQTEEVEEVPQIKVAGGVEVKVPAKDNETDMKVQTPINQAMIKEMDAQVVDYESNPEGNFSRQQNAAEQVVKLSLSPMTKTEANDFANIVNNSKISGVSELSQAKATASAPATKELTNLDILNQINNKLPKLKAGTEKVEIILKPEHLGKVNVELKSLKGAVNATLIAENAQVKEILEKNIETLRNNLSSQGVNVNNLNVKIEETSKSAFNTFDFAQEQFNSEANKEERDSQKFNSDANSEEMNSVENVLTPDEEINGDESIRENAAQSSMVDYKV